MTNRGPKINVILAGFSVPDLLLPSEMNGYLFSICYRGRLVARNSFTRGSALLHPGYNTYNRYAVKPQNLHLSLLCFSVSRFSLPFFGLHSPA